MIFEHYSKNKKILIPVVAVLLAIGVFLVLERQYVVENDWVQISAELQECLSKSDTESHERCQELISLIQDYEDCIAAGFLIMKSNPSQCGTPDGRVFVEGVEVETDPNLLLEAWNIPDPNNKPEVIDIGWQWMVAEKVAGGLVVRGTWDKNDQGIFVSLADADKFIRIKNSEGAPTPYFTTGKNIYIFKTDKNSKKAVATNTPIPTPLQIQEADINTFVPGISHDLSYISKDKNRVYIHGIPDASIDAQTLIALDGMDYFFQYFFKDRNHVYDARPEQGSDLKYKITSYDPQTFEILKSVYGYTKDKNGVYYEDKKIAGADPNTFQVLTTPKLSAGKADHATYSYSKDIKNVYYLGQVIPNADPKTFTPIDTGGTYAHYYGKDGVSVYEGTTTIPFADPKTFRPLWYPIYEGCGPSRYSVDATHVFFEKQIVTGADPATFEALILQYGRDKNGLWFKDKLEKQMPPNFEPVCNYG
ncbi:MAG: DKNYY domain-containing protein [Candidatus Paceibacterota bacterium]|jgi:hypothetical protein